MPRFLQDMTTLADNAGGEAPKPERPDTQMLEDIRLSAGNEQLLALYNRREEIKQAIDSWKVRSDQIKQRWPEWEQLKLLAKHADGLPDAEIFTTQVSQIEQQRQLLDEPNAIQPLIANITQLLRDELNRLQSNYDSQQQKGMQRLEADDNWAQLEPEQRNSLLSAQHLTLASKPNIQVSNAQEILDTLNHLSLSALADRVAAMLSRFDAVSAGAAEMMEPEIQFVSVPRRTLRTDKEIDVWLEELRQQLKTTLKQGPVIVK